MVFLINLYLRANLHGIASYQWRFPELFWVILTGNIFSCTLSMTVFILTSVDGDRFICLSLDEFCGILLQLYPICWPLRAILGEACKVPRFVVSWTLGWLSTFLEKWRWRWHILWTLLLTFTDVRLRTGGWFLCCVTVLEFGEFGTICDNLNCCRWFWILWILKL